MGARNLILLLSVFTVVPVYGTNLLQEGYTVGLYAQYPSQTQSGRMVFDDSGNLYINHFDDGKIIKIDARGECSTLVSGLSPIYDISWGGDTAFGNYLYASSLWGTYPDKIYRIDLEGEATQFTAVTFPYHGPCAIAIDRTGNYNGQLFVGNASNDRISMVTASGTVSTFSTWPGSTDGGGPYGIGFDLSGKYENKMYVATAFESQNAHLSGLFKMNPDGTVGRFATDLVSALYVGFDHVGAYFDNDMFVIGRTGFDASNSLWRVFSDGSLEEFMTDVRTFAFGDDGAMYISHYNWSTQMVTISRVTERNTPVADAGEDQTVYAWIDGLAEVQLDGSGSYHEGGNAVEYFWFLDDELLAEGVYPLVELPAGMHAIELIVYDGVNVSLPSAVMITVIAPVKTNIQVMPNALNRRQGDGPVIGWLDIAGYSENDVDTQTMMILLPGNVAAFRQMLLPAGGPQTKKFKWVGFFEAADFLSAAPDGIVNVWMAVKMRSGLWIYGTDKIQIINPGRQAAPKR